MPLKASFCICCRCISENDEAMFRGSLLKHVAALVKCDITIKFTKTSSHSPKPSIFWWEEILTSYFCLSSERKRNKWIVCHHIWPLWGNQRCSSYHGTKVGLGSASSAALIHKKKKKRSEVNMRKFDRENSVKGTEHWPGICSHTDIRKGPGHMVCTDYYLEKTHTLNIFPTFDHFTTLVLHFQW